MSAKSVGLIELTSVAAGFLVADTMLKAADVQLLLSRSICSGKFMVLIAGNAASVSSAVKTGEQIAHGCVIGTMMIPNIHPDVIAAIGRTGIAEPTGALGIVEAFSVASLLKAADAAVKTSNIQLLELRLAMALGGKAFVTMTGDVASVQEAVASARRVISEEGMLVNAVVLPRPHPAVYREVI
jgi:microcompartment protein CcmL/EutN